MKRSPDRLRSHLVEVRAKHAMPAVGAGIVTRDGDVELDVLGVRIRGGDDPGELGVR